jgi:hypothetical protein
VLKTKCLIIFYIEMVIQICVKLKQVALLNFTVHLHTVISLHNHFGGLHTPAHVQAISITIQLCILMKPQLNTILTSPKMKSYVF